MSDSKHNSIYSAEDIQNYLSGRLTPLQMHAMEKAALDDPFLAEAMEGYAAIPADEWKKELGVLKETFAQKQNGAKVIALPQRKNNWWKAAAAILIIGGSVTFSYIIFNRESRPEIAKNDLPQTVIPVDDSVTAADDNSNSAQTANAGTPQTTPAKEYKTIVKDITRLPAEAAADSGFVYTPSKTAPAAAKITAEENPEREDVVIVTKPAAPVTSNAPSGILNNNSNAAEAFQKNKSLEFDSYKKESKADAGYAKAHSEVALNKTFFAQVLGADNNPLPFANVNIRAENFGTYADVKGNFRLLSNDSTLTVEVKAAGFRPQTVTLKSNIQQNRIILTEDNTAFKERTVISSNTARSKISRKAALLKDSVMNVEPADGWDNYNTYVDNNIEIPDDILKNNIHGEVELSFDVKANGAITNIKVDKSLCGNCDEAAIRMLQQGPQWKVKKGKKGKGKITVQF